MFFFCVHFLYCETWLIVAYMQAVSHFYFSCFYSFLTTSNLNCDIIITCIIFGCIIIFNWTLNLQWIICWIIICIIYIFFLITDLLCKKKQILQFKLILPILVHYKFSLILCLKAIKEKVIGFQSLVLNHFVVHP